MEPVDVQNVAKFFLSCIDEEAGDHITHLKLQKLIYYAQGFHLAMYDTPFFKDPILAWDHGPVVKTIYEKYKEYGSMPIPPDRESDLDEVFTEQQRALLEDVCNVYGQFSAWKLRNMTHAEPPYNNPKNGIITTEAMQEYFKTQIEE